MEITIHIDQANAIRAGRAQWGAATVTVDEAWMAARTQEERELLADCLPGNSNGLPGDRAFGARGRARAIVAATPDALAAWLAAALADEAAKRAKKEAEEAEEAERAAALKRKREAEAEAAATAFEAAVDAYVAVPAAEREAVPGAPSTYYAPAESAARVGAATARREAARAETVRARTEALRASGTDADLVAAHDRAYLDGYDRALLEAALAARLKHAPVEILDTPEREAHAVLRGDRVVLARGYPSGSTHVPLPALDARLAREVGERDAALRAWIEEHGTPSQRARQAERLLPEEEALQALRACVFAPLDGYDRHSKLTLRDVRHSDECIDGRVGYGADDAEGLTEAQYARLCEIRAAAPPGARVTAREHRAYCKSDSCPDVTYRYGALVTVNRSGWVLSREYALPGRGES